MKKTILTIALLFVLITANAQTRSTTLFSKRGIVMRLTVDIKSSDSSYYVACRDSRFTTIVSFVMIADGDKEDIKETLMFYKGVIANGEGYSDQLNGYHAMYYGIYSQVMVYISPKDDSGYTYMNIKYLDKLLAVIE